ncbi:MAG: MerR family transcriptional regulator [Erysipelotrichaceae bacterium]|nr:MerR family transcriptional regulator [Erysipelotrichaceae bacterium]
MRNYLKISEFAKLRNININSLLYYEKLGILNPAYIDPQTKYRYYAPEQLSTLDIILLCIDLHIPLKQLKQYQDQEGYWQKKMIEDGKRIANETIHKLQTDLKKIEYTLKCQEEQEYYVNYQGVYQRNISSRQFIIEEYNNDLNIQQFGRISNQLFDYAKDKDISVVLPSGFMFSYNNDKIDQYLFFETLPTSIKDKKIIEIPKNNYACIQMVFDPNTNYHEFINKYFGKSNRRIVIVSNLIRDKLLNNNRYNEIQVLENLTINCLMEI